MMLEQELEKYLSEQTLCNCDSVSYRNIKNLILGFAEPREKRIAELEKENAELRKVAEFQQSSNMSRHFENKKLKEGLAIGSTFNKSLNSINKNLEEERDKYRNMVFDKDENLTKAKEIIKTLSDDLSMYSGNYQKELLEAKQFLEENSISECIRRATHNYMG